MPLLLEEPCMAAAGCCCVGCERLEPLQPATTGSWGGRDFCLLIFAGIACTTPETFAAPQKAAPTGQPGLAAE